MGYEERDARMEAMRRANEIFGPEKRRAVELLENPVNYPVEKLVPIAAMFYTIPQLTDEAEVRAKTAEFAALVDAVEPLPVQQKPIMLWPSGKVPTITEYTDFCDYRYNRTPDFEPYFYEMLVPEDVTPKGAIVVCAGGNHGEAVLHEGYQVCKDMVELGYQCFLLLNRCNRGPWSSCEAGADASRCIRYVRKNAAKYRVPENRIAFAGFSNGGLTGEAVIEYFSGEKKMTDYFPDYAPDELDEVYGAMDANICVYGPRYDGGPFNWDGVVYPPTFFAIGRLDKAIDNFNYVYPDLLKHNVPVEIHTFSGTPHGQAGSKVRGHNYPNFDLWEPLADYFMQDVYENA